MQQHSHQTVKQSVDYPPVDSFNNIIDNKYTLVVLAARRARELMQIEYQTGEEFLPRKAVSVAMEEIAGGKIICERNR
ncbi:MAG: DNA-directed RNA polymerase subunit omega [Negativicutes bacterium]|nr:DNA-directed RNA polymerase subunit omega [Negativicutes bacterium]